ncbi:MAG: thiamine phosphate synthase [Bacteroidetes bacterium CG23_combo_of_CG06-09_8_20_14_all_32_9]|nr:MAG: thiamine phosphate synthase [Bacteroidetes bacterium CG23_combo_of_CG06-09_8_20_14_all_32_9]
MYSKLQYISQGTTAIEQFENIKSALDAGCGWIQLRFKNCENKNLIELAEKVKKIYSSYNATFIMNDNVEVAKNIDADGVHLGLQDMSITQARNILGKNKIIGGTANTLSDVMMRINENCNYIGLGPFRFTSAKEKLSPVLGLEGYKSIMKNLTLQKFSKLLKCMNAPVYAIGGITIDDVSSLINTGVYGIAVSGAITNHPNKKELIQKFNSLLHEKINNCR